MAHDKPREHLSTVFLCYYAAVLISRILLSDRLFHIQAFNSKKSKKQENQTKKRIVCMAVAPSMSMHFMRNLSMTFQR